MSGRLKYSFCYLVGPMDRVDDGGKEWRNNIIPFLEEMGIIVLNPCNKPIDIGLEDDDSRQYRRELRAEKKYDELARIMKPIRNVDLRMVDKADFLIVNWNWHHKMCGTHEEIDWANRAKKPIVVHYTEGKESAPDWMFAKCPHEMFFSTWDEVREYLTHVHTATDVKHFNRWMFFDISDQIERIACVAQ